MPPVYGISIYSENDGKAMSIHVLINKMEIFDSFAYWKDGHAIRSEVTETEFRSYPYSYTEAFALYSIRSILHGGFS